MSKRKTLARTLFVGVLMDATDERVKSMHDALDEYERTSPLSMKVLKVVPFVDDLISIINTEYKFRKKKK